MPFLNLDLTGISTYIIQGKLAIDGRWPWQVALFLDGSIFPHCAGSILNETFIITAAHCLEHLDVANSSMKITAGVNNLAERDYWQERKLSRSFTHPKYNSFFLKHDIGLIELDFPLEFGERIQPVRLPPSGEELEIGSIVTITGWGDRLLGIPSQSCELLEAQVEVIPEHLCNFSGVFDSICTAFTHQGACFGDSGGPLVFRRSDNKWYLYGITSGTIPNVIDCSSTGRFTKTSTYINWIKYNQS